MQFLVSKLSHVLSPCLGIFIFGCGGNPSIPDAPPPYPTYSTPSYTPPGDSNGYQSPSSYPPITPSLGSQYGNQTDLSPSYKQDYFAPPPNPNQSSLNPRYTVTAEANIWVLVQDEFGTEIDWKKLSKGESMSITHPRPITVTCSSGSKVKIYDEKGKAVKQLVNSSGIAIVRLP
jgi:hypothetical protein